MQIPEFQAGFLGWFLCHSSQFSPHCPNFDGLELTISKSEERNLLCTFIWGAEVNGKQTIYLRLSITKMKCRVFLNQATKT